MECQQQYHNGLIIGGDFNIHVDVCNDLTTVKFQQILGMLVLTQHVRTETHLKGHILDLVIGRDVDNLKISRLQTEKLSLGSLYCYISIINSITPIREKGNAI